MGTDPRSNAASPADLAQGLDLELGPEDDLFQFDGLIEESALQDPALALAPEVVETHAQLDEDGDDGATAANDAAHAAVEPPSVRPRSRGFAMSLAARRTWLIVAAFLLLNLAGLGIVVRSQSDVA